MGRDLIDWLAGYHFFKQQYVARNSQYIPLADQFFDLEDEFSRLGIKTGMKFRYLVQDIATCSTYKATKDSYIERLLLKKEYADDLQKKSVDILMRSANVLMKIDKLGGESWTNFGDDPMEMLKLVANNEDVYWTIPELCTSYKRSEGSIRLPTNVTKNIHFNEQKGHRQAVCTINLDEPLEEQFNAIMKILTLMTMNNDNNRENDLYKLDDRSYIIEYEEIIKNTIVSYDNSGDKSRCIGLWLWDKVQEFGNKRGDKVKAIKELELLSFFDKLSLGYDPDYYHWLKRTAACIEAAEVLTFDKKNPESKKRKRSSGTRKRKLVPGTKAAK